MRQKEIELLYAYFVNNLTHLEGDLVTCRNSIRYREIDPVDCLEMMLAIERKNMFVLTMNHVFELLNLKYCEVEEEAAPSDKR